MERMKTEHLTDIISVDEIAFNRSEKRNLENLEAARLSDPQGCFVLLDGQRLVGYSCSRTMGSQGYLGPLSLLPQYQFKGYGRLLISKNLEYLKLHCKVIGLEVLPELGDNIGLYHKLGFFTGLPSLLFHFPRQLEPAGPEFQVKVLSDTSSFNQHHIIQKIDAWTGKKFEGVSYAGDLRATLDHQGLVLAAFDNNQPVAFLAYSETILPYLWGVVKPIEAQKDVMKHLLTTFSQINNLEGVIAQVNSRYRDLVDLLVDLNFKVHRSVNRMYLKGYGGDGLKISRDMVMKGWRG